MLSLGTWFRPPRHVLTIFVGLALVSAGALVFLVRLLVGQDRAVEDQRRRERLEQATDLAVFQMRFGLTILNDRAATGELNAALPKGVVTVGYDPPTAEKLPKAGLLYYPETPQAPPAHDDPRLIEAQRLEFAERNPRAAGILYGEIAKESGLRPVALSRMARAQRKAGDVESALRTYDRLETLSGLRTDGLPAGLIARVGRASIYEASHRLMDLQREASALVDDLRRGRWRLIRSEYIFYAEEAGRWLDTAGASKPQDRDIEGVARTEAAQWVWKEKPWIKGAPAAARLIQAGGQPVLVTWTGSTVVIASQTYFGPLCAAAIADSALQCALTDPEGRSIAGAAAAPKELAGLGTLTAIRTPAGAGLPWGLQVSSTTAAGGVSPPQRNILYCLLAVVSAVWFVGMVFIVGALQREIRVARMQSDFVAAVSHEFRSPLASIAQISELLLTDRLPSEDLRRKSYGLLARESARLRRLVEGLLDFGRLESGRAVYRFEPLELGEYLESLAADFGERVGPDGYRVELHRPARPITARADREALTRALTNLLDNAVKYSPECKTVWMDLEPMDSESGRIGITVRDRGLGIPEREQQDVFERFVRGSNSRNLRIKGAGIGLATALHIAQAHGGRILLSSTPGEGSRFTIVLPENS